MTSPGAMPNRASPVPAAGDRVDVANGSSTQTRCGEWELDPNHRRPSVDYGMGGPRLRSRAKGLSLCTYD